MTEPTSYSSTSTADFPDGSRVRTTVVYYPPPDPAPSPRWTGPRLVGVHDDRPPNQLKITFPGTMTTRPFIANVLTGPRSLLVKAENACRPSWAAGLLPTYSLKLDYAEVMAGGWDRFITELAAWHLDQPRAELILWHEPENDTVMQNGAFPVYFNRIATLFRAQNATVPLLYAAMAYQWLPGKVNGTVKGFTSRPQDWQRVAADRLVIDAYSGGDVPLSAILPEHPGWQRWMQHVVGDRDWGVAERGFVLGPNVARDTATRAEAIRREQDWLLHHPTGQRCHSYIYWNTSGREENANIVLDPKIGEPAVRELITALAG